ncbi:D-arabinono-1,4-lactone oxidase [Salininema proteolyticum]|uniref:D-arabinono-1,4-lactone oxidase n=1 Tax=Salininema proteolyticum TaxID=1607685 RepID=A0ABV8U0N8_9ACTN
MAHWSNWASTATADDVEIARPATRDELTALAAEAIAAGRRIRPLGSGHSFSAVGEPVDLAVDLSLLDRVVSVDRETGRATVEGGIKMRHLNEALGAHGLALENMGDIDRQSITGALSTGTHGTGAGFGGLATQVRAVEILTGTGEVLRLDEHDPMLRGAVVSLGALGVILSVTLQCVPAFRLEAVEAPLPLDEVLSRLDEFCDETDHFEFYWFPNTDRTLTKRNRRVGDGAAKPPSALHYWWNESFTENILFSAANRVGSKWKSKIPAINGLSTKFLSPRTYTDRSHRVFTSPRKVVFREMEYALPRSEARAAVRELTRWVDRCEEGVSFPLEVRFAGADGNWLSTAYERDTVYLAVHQYHRNPHERFFAGAEDVFTSFGGRPHWGKMHTRDAGYLAEQYPRHPDFLALRDECDPERVFSNAYLEKVLGA